MIPISTVSKYTLIEAYKRRLIAVFGFSLIICFAMASYASSLVITEKLSTFSAFYGFGIRIISVILIGIYLVLNESTHLDKNLAFFSLALPISRFQFLAYKYLAYIIIVFLMATTAIIPLLIVGTQPTVALSWGATLFFELILVISAALMLVIFFKQPLFTILLLFIFYIFSRSSGEFLRHSNAILAGNNIGIEWLMAWILKATTFLVPKLELFTKTNWLLYGNPDLQWTGVLAQTIIYSTLLFIATAVKLRQRVF